MQKIRQEIPIEEIDFKPYFFIGNKVWTFTSFALFAVGLAVTEFLFSLQISDEYTGWLFAALTGMIFVISSLGGYATGANMVFVAFIIETIKADGFAFNMYICFVPACIAIIPIRRGWYCSVKKALFALLWFPVSFSVGFVPFSIYIGNLINLQFWLWLIPFAFLPSLFVTVLGVLYFKFVPVRVRKLFKSYFYENELKYRVLHRNTGLSDVLERKCTVPLAYRVVIICILSLMIASFGSAVLSTFALPEKFISSSFTAVEWRHYQVEAHIVRFLFLATLLANVINYLYGLLTVPLTIITKAFRNSSHSIARARNTGEIHTLELPVNSHDEIGILYDALKRSEKHVIAYLESVEREINLQNDLKVANAASEAKSSFLSSMSHEIRSPINAVLGLDEMIIRESGEPQIRGYAVDIQSSGKMLLSLISDILDFSKIEAGKMEIIPVDYDMTAVISDLVNMIDARAKAKNLDFIVNIDEEMPHLLHGDDTRLKQCILNILTNGVKYTPQGSVTLTMSGRKIDDTHAEIFVSVKDTGIGIKQEDIKKLFSPFERIEEGRNRAIEGTGLGMSIVKSLLASMNTQLDVRSVYGEGSDFSFRVVQEVRGWEKIGNYAETKKKLQESAAAYTESFQAPDAKILVIDDTPINLTVMKGLLRETRVQIDTAESGMVALEKARSQKYDVIFVDHMMPKMDGLQFIKNLHADESSANQNAICVALTANAIDGVKEFYKNAGFEDYLSKPIESKKLEAMLQEYLPEEKVLHKGDAGFTERTDGSAASAGADAQSASPVLPGAMTAEAESLLKKIFGIDFSLALRNCGGADVFMDAAGNFYDAVDEKSGSIEEYARNGDWKNYTILVHALKSSARLIGAAELSDLAKELEAAGDEAQKNSSVDAAARIAEKTPALLADYRAYKAKLAPLLGKSAVAKPGIARNQLDDALSALREVVSVFDFDSADSIIKELDGYEMSADFAHQFAQIKKAVRDVDQAKIMGLLGKV